MMVHFYTVNIESILSSSIAIWHASATAKDKGRLQRMIHSAEKVIGSNLAPLKDAHASRTLKHAGKIVANSSHPGHSPFVSLPSYRTSQHKNSFLTSAMSPTDTVPSLFSFPQRHITVMPVTVCLINTSLMLHSSKALSP